jgi:large subunit ribosomal protein L13
MTETATATEKRAPLVGRTPSAREVDVVRKWYVVDAEGLIVGRLSSQIAHILRGKHKVQYTPHVDCGDFVVVVNADKVVFTGNKETDKFYYTHVDRKPGSLKAVSPARKRETHPEDIVTFAVRGMLPKTRLGRQMLMKLKVYAGAKHPHTAQAPETLKLAE